MLVSCSVSQITREGKYLQSDVPRQLLYGTMVYVRQAIVSNASKALSRSVCISVRYSAVRGQFGSQDGSSETQVHHQCSVLRFTYAMKHIGGIHYTNYKNIVGSNVYFLLASYNANFCCLTR